MPTATTIERSNSANPYLDLSLPELRDAQRRIAAELLDVKKIAAQIDEAVGNRVAQEIASARRYHNKPDGTVSVIIEGVEVKSNVPRRVEWNTATLDEVCIDIEGAGANPMDYLEYKLTIPEKNYKKMPEQLRKIVDKARVTKYGSEKIELKDDEA